MILNSKLLFYDNHSCNINNIKTGSNFMHLDRKKAHKLLPQSIGFAHFCPFLFPSQQTNPNVITIHHNPEVDDPEQGAPPPPPHFYKMCCGTAY